MQDLTRRDFIKHAGVATLGVIAVSGIAGTALSCVNKDEAAKPDALVQAAAASGLTAVPWPYAKLDLDAVAERAYASYSNGGCMYGAFEGIIGELRNKIGSPYDNFPVDMMKYGGAGVQGWGTLCGALNGISAAVYLITDAKVGGPVISDVFGWYGAAPLPDYKPAKPKFENIVTSTSNSPLCHVSVTEWCNQASFKATSPERAERCAWLTASVARHTVDLLNKNVDGAYKASFVLSAPVTGCLSCHGKGGPYENVHQSKATDCAACHTDFETKHPRILK